jgi:hypothetical protein
MSRQPSKEKLVWEFKIISFTVARSAIGQRLLRATVTTQNP